MICPTFARPKETRYAPTRMTAVMPRFKSRFINGLVIPIVTPAFVSQDTTFSLIFSNDLLSYSVLESALITRMPE